jgi:hypothetical protein
MTRSHRRGVETYRYFCLGSFAEPRKATITFACQSVRESIHLHGTTRLALEGF